MQIQLDVAEENPCSQKYAVWSTLLKLLPVFIRSA